MRRPSRKGPRKGAAERGKGGNRSKGYCDLETRLQAVIPTKVGFGREGGGLETPVLVRS